MDERSSRVRASTSGEFSGADLMVSALAAAGVDTCFVNPGTSELHFMAALGRNGQLRSVPCLTESVATGAADGYGRTAGKPAAVLLHCGPGLANGLANLHNARRAGTPVIVLVGDHATYHQPLDPPLATDTMALAAPMAKFVRRSVDPARLAADVEEAVAASIAPPSGVAVLVVPSDLSWSAASAHIAGSGRPARAVAPPPGRLEVAARALMRGNAAILLGGEALGERCVTLASRLASHTGARLLASAQVRRIARGRGRPAVPRLAYDVDEAALMLAGVETVLLFGTGSPVAFFALPGRRQTPLPEGVTILTPADPGQSCELALEALVERLGCPPVQEPGNPHLAPPPDGPLDSQKVAQVLSAVLPRDAIVIDEGVSLGRTFFNATANAAPHDWLQLTGGAIGSGIPMATGAAIAAPGRSIVSLQADGSGLYTLQGLWTQARERLRVTTLLLSNRSYAILLGEAHRLGLATEGPLADACRLDDPPAGWLQLANGFGVPASRAGTSAELAALLEASFAREGPCLIEAAFT